MATSPANPVWVSSIQAQLLMAKMAQGSHTSLFHAQYCVYISKASIPKATNSLSSGDTDLSQKDLLLLVALRYSSIKPIASGARRLSRPCCSRSMRAARCPALVLL